MNTPTKLDKSEYQEVGSHHVSPIRCCWSIKSLLLVFPVLVITMILFTGLFVWMLSYVNTTISIKDLSNQLQREITSRITEKSLTLLDVPPILGNVVVNNNENVFVDLGNYEQTRSYMWNYFKTFSQLSFISLSTVQDVYYSYERTTTNEIKWYIRNSTIGNARWTYACNTVNGMPLYANGPIAIRAGYRPTTRDWFIGTVAAAGPYWSDIYAFTSGDNGLTHGQPLRNSTNPSSIYGVVTADFTLAELNVFLRGLKISSGGKAFIAEKNGYLVASSSGNVNDGTGTVRLLASSSADTGIAQAAKYIISRYGTFGAIFSSQNKTQVDDVTTIDGETMLLLTSQFTYNSRIDWVIVILVPEKDFYSRVYTSTAITMSITGVTLLFSLVLALIISICLGIVITRPLESVSSQMTKIANIEFTDTDKNSLSSLYEFIQMEQSLKKMKHGLAQFKKFVPKSFLKALKVAQLTDVKLGTCVSRDLSFIYVDLRSFSSVVRDLSAEEMFSQLNAFMAEVGPIVRQHQGFIAKFVGAGFIAAFTESKKALKTARLIVSKAAELKMNNETVQVSISMMTGKITAGTIGEDEQIDTTFISDTISVLMFMNSVAKHYNLSIVVPREELSNKSLKDYKCRFVNMYKLKDVAHVSSSTLEIYEVTNDAVKVETYDMYSKACDIVYKAQGKLAEAIHLLDYVVKKCTGDVIAENHYKICKRLLEDDTFAKMNLPIQLALREAAILDAFETFCKQEHSSENVNLWKGIEHYRLLQTPEQRRKHAEFLYTSYIDKNAENAVNVTDKERENLGSVLSNPNYALEVKFFDPVQLEVQILMMDTFKRFRVTNQFEDAYASSSCRKTIKDRVVRVDMGYGFEEEVDDNVPLLPAASASAYPPIPFGSPSLVAK